MCIFFWYYWSITWLNSLFILYILSEGTAGSFGPFSIREKDLGWQDMIWATFIFWVRSISSWTSEPQGTKVDKVRLLWFSLCVFTWLSYKHTSHWITVTVKQCDLILSNYICKTLIRNYVISTGSRGWAFNIFFWGTQSNTQPPSTTSFWAQALNTCPGTYTSYPCQLSGPVLLLSSSPILLQPHVSSSSQTSLKSCLSLCFTMKPFPTTLLKMENHSSKHSLSFLLLRFQPEITPPSHRLPSVVVFSFPDSLSRMDWNLHGGLEIFKKDFEELSLSHSLKTIHLSQW